ncbi:translation initiation factor IF-2 [Sorochytrium milnesiophthora]
MLRRLHYAYQRQVRCVPGVLATAARSYSGFWAAVEKSRTAPSTSAAAPPRSSGNSSRPRGTQQQPRFPTDREQGWSGQSRPTDQRFWDANQGRQQQRSDQGPSTPSAYVDRRPQRDPSSFVEGRLRTLAPWSTPPQAAPRANPDKLDLLEMELKTATIGDDVAVMAKPSRVGRNHYHDHKTHHHLRAADAQQLQQQQPQQRPGDSGTSAAFEKEKAKRNVHRGDFKDVVSRFRREEDQDEDGLLGDEATPRRRILRKKQVPRDILLPEAINVANFSKLTGVRVERMTRQVATLLGIPKVTPDYVLTAEVAALVAAEVAPHINTMAPHQDDGDTANAAGNDTYGLQLTPRAAPGSPEYAAYPPRAPVVTIMGHVDHGKTTLLDALRKSSIVASEAGGITQHIGAFEVRLPSGQTITFLDTPGHSAFESMRARGAQVTDMVVLVVAADDGVMPQTVEAIKHAQAAEAPIIVAINKCDKPGADRTKVKEGLLRYGIQLEEYGGDIQAVEISALKQTGLNDLEEAIVTLSEVLDLRADPAGSVEGVIIESKMQKGKGNTASVLVNHGTLKVGDILVAGTSWCRVRSMHNDHGAHVTEAPPSTPVEVVGWKDLPGAGDRVLAAPTEDVAKSAVEKHTIRLQRAKELQAIDSINERRIGDRVALLAERRANKGRRGPNIQTPATKSDAATDGPAVVAAVVKGMSLCLAPCSLLALTERVGDVSGSVEAVVDALEKIKHPEVQLNIIQTGVGPVAESDIELASATDGLVIGFNVRADKKTQALAKQHGVTLQSSNIIYKLVDNVKQHLSTFLAPQLREDVVGEATIAQVFELNRSSKTGASSLKVLKSFKKDVNEVSKGNECGMAFDGFQDFQEGDIVRAVATVEVARHIE